MQRRDMSPSAILLVGFLATATSSSEDPNPPTFEQSRWQLSGALGLPFFVFFRGYAGELAVRVANLERWRFAANTFMVHIPRIFLGEGNEHWRVRHVGGSLGVQRFFTTRGGPFIGLHANVQENASSRGDDTVRVIELGVLPQLGYQWYPHASAGLFITPWVGVPVQLYRSAKVQLGGVEFHHKPFTLVPSLNLGWEL